MRLALAGKGGAGKTTISATLARLTARRGVPVVAIDADSNPNLSVALGLDPAQGEAMTSLPVTIVSRRLDGGPALTVPVDQVVADHSVVAPDGVRLMRMGMPGHAGEGCMCSAHATVSALLHDLGREPGTLTLVDLEASPEHLSRGTAGLADVLVLVAEPYYRSLEAVGRLAALAAELPIGQVAVVVNKVRSPADAEAVGLFCDRHHLERLGQVPWSEEVVEADRAATPLLDAFPDGPVAAAVGELADRLMLVKS